MMKAEDYVVSNHLAAGDLAELRLGRGRVRQHVSRSQNLRYAFKNAAANGVTVLGSSGDGGTANAKKTPVSQGGTLFPFPTVEWPASDPLVTGVGGTYLCTDPTATTNQPRTTHPSPASAPSAQQSVQHGAGAEVAWTFSGGGFSHVFSRPSYQAGRFRPAAPPIPASARGVPDIAFQASAATGALVYLSLPPDGRRGAT